MNAALDFRYTGAQEMEDKHSTSQRFTTHVHVISKK